ncbi:MAG: methylated-DNA--[protein]-cysteine S-methyltransferase [Flavobacteriaceae bacterium]|nr:methylated-DNA--[protein]-cysteine S-methyltransferase [Flavobacteriaceae bacterium]MCY4217036.1 methylated-DNA--[protein]-cysteine S-methyltransferase [Flavobacteriaceae bacterium]
MNSDTEPANLDYYYYESPFGILETCSKNSTLVGLKFVNNKTKTTTKPSPFQQKVRNQLNAYFFHGLKIFNLPIRIEGTDFQKRIWNYLLSIPYGSTVSYQTIADALNMPSSTRAIATNIGKNPILIIIPCHRVIGIDGSLKGYSGGLNRKARLIDLENKKYFYSLPIDHRIQ